MMVSLECVVRGEIAERKKWCEKHAAKPKVQRLTMYCLTSAKPKGSVNWYSLDMVEEARREGRRALAKELLEVEIPMTEILSLPDSYDKWFIAYRKRLEKEVKQ